MELKTNEVGYRYIEVLGVFDTPVEIYYQQDDDCVSVDVPDCGCCGGVSILTFQASHPPLDNDVTRALVIKALEAVRLLRKD